MSKTCVTFRSHLHQSSDAVCASACWVLSLSLLAGCASAQRLLQASPLAVSTSTAKVHTLLVEGRRRTYRLYVPPDYDDQHPLPLVIVLHGHGGTGKRMMRLSGMNVVADRSGVVVAYPDGTSWLGMPWRSWNSGNCCGYAMRRGVDDVRFIEALIDELGRTGPIDPGRVYVAGVSNGGMMAHRVGCELSDRVAAIGIVAGALGVESCEPSSPVSVMMLHGTADDSVRYHGGPSPKSSYRRIDRSVAEAVAFWVERNGCSGVPRIDQRGTVLQETYRCDGHGTEVVLYTLEGGGHEWPGRTRGWRFRRRATDAFSANTTLWDFFSRHAKPTKL